jgi:hypothetical protein
MKNERIKVTKKQVRAVELQKKEWRNDLKTILLMKENGVLFHNEFECFNHMSDGEIALCWIGHVDVEPEYVSFEEAIKALKDGKKVAFQIQNDAPVVIDRDVPVIRILDDFNGCSIEDIWMHVKWTIEEEER